MPRLMIVEDELLVAASLVTLLEAHGHEIAACVATADEAVSAAREVRPELILMDIHLRGPVDGVVAAGAIRAHADVPIVFLTAYADRAHLERAKGTEPHAYLLKPYSDRELLTTVEIVLHRHRAEREVRVRDRWLGTTLRSIGDGVIGVDSDRRIQFVNRVAEDLTGWTAAEAAGRPLAEVLPLLIEGTREPRHLPLQEAMSDGTIRTLSGPTVLARRDGRELPIEDSVAAIADDDGSVVGGVVVFRDVTERRTMEARLALADRMSSLATFTAGLGHELNNPLSYTLTNLEVVLEGLLPRLRGALVPPVEARGAGPSATASEALREIEQALADAREGAGRMRDILRTIHNFSRGRSVPDQPVDLVEVVEAAIRLTANEVAQRTNLVRNFRARPTVQGHAGQLSQVFTNLLNNAAQAVPAGATRGPISVVVDANERTASVEITDPGTGIAPDLMVRIFEPFFTTKPLDIGTGLGLAIVHNVVKRHGGDVEVTSRVGQGTTFRVILPRVEPPAPVQEPRAAAPGRARLLLVDDDPRVRRALGRVLAKDFDVTVVASGPEAIARLGAETFDALLLDLMMPGMTGLSLYEWILAARPSQAERVLFLTGGAFTAETQAFVAAMGDRVLLKAEPAADLARAIARICRRP